MLYEPERMRSGDMDAELSLRVDEVISEFMAVVDGMTEERHLQRGIARSQLPCSIVAILDKRSLSIMGQFRLANRTASYFHRPEIAITGQQAANSAGWEFGFDDPFIIQLPSTLIEMSTVERRAELLAAASRHIDSEHLRFEQMLSLMRTRPIFTQAAEQVFAKSILLLLPARTDEDRARTRAGALGLSADAIIEAISGSDLSFENAPDIRFGRAALLELWHAVNRSSAIVADLTGADPEVMYALGIAHTLGKETVLIYPQGSKYLTDIPRTHRIEYRDGAEGISGLREDLTRTLGSLFRPVVED